MNTLYDKGVLNLIKNLVSDHIEVVYSSSDDSLINISKRYKNGQIKLPAVIFFRSSGMNLYLNEAVQCNLNYGGTNLMNINIDDKYYLDTMAYNCDLPYTIMVLANRIEDAYEFAEELAIKMKMYPAVNIEMDINLQYMRDNVPQVYKAKGVKFQCSVELEGGGSGLSIEDSSETVNNFGETAGLYRLEFSIILRAMVFKFRVGDRIERSSIIIDD